MAPKTSDTTRNASGTTRSNRDSIRWTCGLLLLFAGLYLTAAVLFYYFNWRADMSYVSGVVREDPRLAGQNEVENLCGPWGAWMAERLVGRSFGLFGIILPLILVMVGIRIIRQRPMLVNHSVLSALLVLILGSLTLGFACGGRWEVFGSGWGGAFGIEMARLLSGSIGAFGTIIVLLGAWILTGVFINRNFINTVNTAGNAMVDQGGKIVEIVRHSVGHVAERGRERSRPESPVPQPEAVAADEKARDEAFREEPEERQAAPVAAPEAASVAKEAESTAAAADEEENPFLEISTGGEAPGEELPAPAVSPEQERTAAAAYPAGDDAVFMEFDLSDDGGKPASRPETATGSDPQPEERWEEGIAEISLRPEEEEQAAPVPEVLPEDAPYGAEADSETGTTERWAEEPAGEESGIVVTVESHEAEVLDERSIETDLYDPLKDLIHYQRPPVSLLEDYTSDSQVSDEEIFENKTRIEETLKYFGIPIQRIKATVGPTVTLYEIVQAQGVKISKIQGLQNDIAQSLKAESGIRIIAPIPGKGTIGIEVPNRNKQIVSMNSAVRSRQFQESNAGLPVVIGRTIQNDNYVFDLARMPHLLVAGATGQGKSVGLNAIIASLLYKKHPAELKFVMIDPKMVEFSLYARIEKHFLAKMESEEEAIVTDPRKAVYTLNALCTEMDTRLELCKMAGARNIAEYNDKFTARRLNPLKGHRFLPYIVVVIDEFADLIMTAKEVEVPVTRLAQKARAIGIHLIIATQRPSVDVITGKIKANFPSRIAFRVMQMIDSRTIIDRPGADQLIGRGDMLISKDGELTRVQCAFADTPDVERVVEYIARQQSYTSAYALPDYTPESGGGDSPAGLGSESESGKPVRYDALFAEIARSAVETGSISTSSIQRNYEVGFNRAGRIMMQLERAGIVGRQEGAKPRDIYFHDLPSLEARLQELGLF
ncbi:MAG: DNA translocase FtsK [Alistipes sp.]|nr:DNA translocase FtsK [Alistipes sp.]